MIDPVKHMEAVSRLIWNKPIPHLMLRLPGWLAIGFSSHTAEQVRFLLCAKGLGQALEAMGDRHEERQAPFYRRLQALHYWLLLFMALP